MSAITPSWIDSFGHGYFTISLGRGMYSNVDGSPTTSTTVIRGQGTRSLLIQSTTANDVRVSYADQVIAVMFYLRFETLPADDQEIVRFTNANGNGELGWKAADGKLYVKAGSASAVSFGPVLKDDRWYRVCMEYDTSTGTATMRGVVDNAFEGSATNTQTAANITDVRVGRCASVTNAVSYYISSMVQSKTNGDYETMKTWPQHDVEDLHPTSDGTHNIAASGDFDSDTTNAFSNSSTDVYTYLDQAPFTGTAGADNNVRQDVSDTSAYVEVVFENSSNLPVVDAVRACGSNNDDGGLGDSQAEIRLLLSGGTEVTRDSGLSVQDSSVDHPGNLPEFFKRIMDAPGGSWDSSEVDGLKYRVGFSDANPITHFWNMMVEVMSHQEPGGESFMTIITER